MTIPDNERFSAFRLANRSIGVLGIPFVDPLGDGFDDGDKQTLLGIYYGINAVKTIRDLIGDEALAADKQSVQLPHTPDFLPPTGFEFVLSRTPHVSYFCDRADLPSIQIGTPEAANPLLVDHYPGDKVQFQNLSLRFRIDEDMRNYLEIYDWMNGLGSPNSSDQYKQLVGGNYGELRHALSDGTLLIQNSHHNTKIHITFHRMFPTSLAPVVFNTTDSSLTYLQCDVQFSYSAFTARVLT